MTPNPPQSARMPEEIWSGRDKETGIFAYCHSEQKPCHTRYIRDDLAIPKDKLQGWIEAMEKAIDQLDKAVSGGRIDTKIVSKILEGGSLLEMKEMVKP